MGTLSSLLADLAGEQPDYSGGNDPNEEERKRLLAQQQADASRMNGQGSQPAVSQAMASAGQLMEPAASPPPAADSSSSPNSGATGGPNYADGGKTSPLTVNGGWPSVNTTGQGYGNPTQTTGNASLGSGGDSGLLGTGMTDKQRQALKQSGKNSTNAANSAMAAARQLMGQMQATNQQYLDEPDYSR